MDAYLKEAIAAELNVDAIELTPGTRLVDLDRWDSVMTLTVMLMVGEAVGKEVGPADVVRLETFGDIEDLVARKAA